MNDNGAGKRRPSVAGMIDELAGGDRHLRQFLITAARYVFGGRSRAAGTKSPDPSSQGDREK